MSPEITVTSYDLAQQILSISAHACSQITHVISINDPGQEPPPALKMFPGERLLLTFHDVTSASNGARLPSRDDLSRILAFTGALTNEHHVLIHCWGGISRSTASALLVLASRRTPSEDAATDVIKETLALKRMIRPNKLMVFLGDNLLGWGGTLYEVYRKTFLAGTGLWTPPA